MRTSTTRRDHPGSRGAERSQERLLRVCVTRDSRVSRHTLQTHPLNLVSKRTREKKGEGWDLVNVHEVDRVKVTASEENVKFTP